MTTGHEPSSADDNPLRGRSLPADAPDLPTLIGLFYDRPEPLGVFTSVEIDAIPEPSRGLLVHEHHMTVTVEAFHNCPVDVVVLRRNATRTHYAREILLARARDKVRVQYGIMRVALDCLDSEVRDEIENESQPLGRILIQHNVLRSVELCGLWQVAPGPALRAHIPRQGISPQQDVIYGRTALIHCNSQPAIELLEIVF